MQSIKDRNGEKFTIVIAATIKCKGPNYAGFSKAMFMSFFTMTSYANLDHSFIHSFIHSIAGVPDE